MPNEFLEHLKLVLAVTFIFVSVAFFLLLYVIIIYGILFLIGETAKLL